MENLKKENEALKSYIETLKNDRLVLLEQVKKCKKIKLLLRIYFFIGIILIIIEG